MNEDIKYYNLLGYNCAIFYNTLQITASYSAFITPNKRGPIYYKTKQYIRGRSLNAKWFSDYNNINICIVFDTGRSTNKLFEAF